MEELRCKGTPAQVATQTLRFLYLNYPDLLTKSDGDYPGEEALLEADDKPVFLLNWLAEYGRNMPKFQADAPYIGIVIFRDSVPLQEMGAITASGVPYGTLVRAGQTEATTWFYQDGRTRRITTDRNPAELPLLPIWEAVKAELIRLGFAEQQVTPTIDSQEKAKTERNRLLRNLVEFFSKEELHTLAFHMAVDYENLPTQGKDGEARELIIHLERLGRIPELVEHCRRLRPMHVWEDMREP